jgi:hypothetical protein
MVESIPLINALLAAMGMTAAGATGNKIKLSAEDQAALKKYAKGVAKVTMGLDGLGGGPSTTNFVSAITKPLMAASGVADMVHAVKNGGFEGPSNTPSKKEDNTPNNKNNGDNNPPPPPVVSNKKPNWKEMTYDERMARAQEDLMNSHLSSSEAEKATKIAESKQRLRDAANNGWEALDETKMIDYKGPKKLKSSQEAIDASREKYLNGKPNSIDIDKLASEYKGYQKSKLNNKTVEQKSSDIMEYKRPLEKLRMIKPAASPEDILKFLGKNLSIMGILIKTLDADEAEAAEYEERYEEIADAFMHARTLEDVKIANQMAKDFEKDVGPKAMNAIKDKVMGSFNKEDKEEE